MPPISPGSGRTRFVQTEWTDVRSGITVGSPEGCCLSVSSARPNKPPGDGQMSREPNEAENLPSCVRRRTSVVRDGLMRRGALGGLDDAGTETGV